MKEILEEYGGVVALSIVGLSVISGLLAIISLLCK